MNICLANSQVCAVVELSYTRDIIDDGCGRHPGRAHLSGTIHRVTISPEFHDFMIASVENAGQKLCLMESPDHTIMLQNCFLIGGASLGPDTILKIGNTQGTCNIHFAVLNPNTDVTFVF